MKDNASSCTTNIWCQSDGEVRAVVNPHNITASDPFEKRPKYLLQHCPMKNPWKFKKIPASVTITSQIWKYKYGFGKEVPRVVN
jgi:hypothetical protein